jgi:hypothetical protein
MRRSLSSKSALYCTRIYCNMLVAIKKHCHSKLHREGNNSAHKRMKKGERFQRRGVFHLHRLLLLLLTWQVISKRQTATEFSKTILDQSLPWFSAHCTPHPDAFITFKLACSSSAPHHLLSRTNKILLATHTEENIGTPYPTTTPSQYWTHNYYR